MRRLHVVFTSALLASTTLAVRPTVAPAQVGAGAPGVSGASRAGVAERPDTARFPVGSYRTSSTKAELPPPLADLAGDWEVRFGADGRFALLYLTTTGPRAMDRGGYTVEGRLLTIVDDPDAPMSCGRVEASAGKGVYTWEARGRQLVFKPVDDPCMGRRYGLSGKPLVRAPDQAPAAAAPAPAPPR
jgi:hypothetical protein